MKIRYDVAVSLVAMLIATVFYLPTAQYGFVSDFLGWMVKYKEGSPADIPGSFGYRGLHPFFHLVNYSFFRFAGLSGFLWTLFFAMLHGVNGYLVFKVTFRMSELIKIKSATSIAIISSLIFLLNPYQVEVVTWKACLHYLMSMALFGYGFLLIIQWLDTKNPGKIWKHHLVFLLSMLTLEINLAAPFIFLAYVLVYVFTQQKVQDGKAYAKWFLLPHMIVLVSYFVANQLILGDIVGHYGAEQHLVFDPNLIAGNGLKYLSKYLFFIHFLGYETRQVIYGLCTNWAVILPVTIGVIGGLWYFIKKKKTKELLLACTLLAFLMALVPVITLWFNDQSLYENDRYGYYASFHMAFFMGILLSFFRRRIRWVFFTLLISLHLYFLGLMLTYTQEAGNLCHNLLEDYQWEERDVLFMGIPQNYNGLYMYGNYDGESISFRRSIELLKGKTISGSMQDVAHFNMKRPLDKVDITRIDEITYKAGIAQGGTWFWRKSRGLKDHETDIYSLKLDDWSYTITLKDTTTDYLFLAVKNGTWTTLE
jgi:hypothetical protein